MEAKQLNLGKAQGLPMYFLCERKKTEMKTHITFADIEKHEDLVNGLVFIWGRKYKVTAINEIRNSGQNYGVDVPVYFHDITADFIPDEAKK